MKFNLLLSIIIVFTSNCSNAQIKDKPVDSVSIKPNNNEYWWAGVIRHGHKMPLQEGYKVSTWGNNWSNQIQPLLLSNNGSVIWSEEPLKIEYTQGQIEVAVRDGKIINSIAGKNLQDAFKFASKNYFPPSGKAPDEYLFSRPQYNTWIELMKNQNQEDVLKYANGIINSGLNPGVIMIDMNWDEYYGSMEFHSGKFPNPKEMIDSLHSMEFKVMLWMCPFITADSPVYRELRNDTLLLLRNDGEPAMLKWWEGQSAALDFTNPKAVEWYKSQLNYLINEYGIDGFKFDAGDSHIYKKIKSYNNVTASEHTRLFNLIGLDYPLNEYRAAYKMGGQALAQRLLDKKHTWEDLQKLIPDMLLEGLMGYSFSCPDMIGGGLASSFKNGSVIDQDLIVRSAQCHALMPMMQFSVAPWRILDKKHLGAVVKSTQIREQFTSYIIELVKLAATTGEPIMRHMEYVFPHQGYSEIKDQFLLGDRVLVAPVVVKGAKSREVIIPKGKWKGFDGRIVEGPVTINVKVTLKDLPFFELQPSKPE